MLFGSMKATTSLIFLLSSLIYFVAAEHSKLTRDESKQCDYCEFYEKTGLSPYELLWTVAAEVSPVLDIDERTPMLMNPEHLRMAERHFDVYCEENCKTIEYPEENFK